MLNDLRNYSIWLKLAIGAWVAVLLFYLFGSSFFQITEVVLVSTLYVISLVAEIFYKRDHVASPTLDLPTWMVHFSLGLVGYFIILPLMGAGDLRSFVAGLLILLICTFPPARFLWRARAKGTTPTRQ